MNLVSFKKALVQQATLIFDQQGRQQKAEALLPWLNPFCNPEFVELGRDTFQINLSKANSPYQTPNSQRYIVVLPLASLSNESLGKNPLLATSSQQRQRA